MAPQFQPKDIASVLNALIEQLTGKNPNLQNITSQQFVSVGGQVLSYGTENVINALSTVIGRTLIAVRPYRARLSLINPVNSGTFTNRMRKISYYSSPALESGWFNTDKHINLQNGKTNVQSGTGTASSTPSMWEQNAPEVLEWQFAGTNTWQDSITIYENQLHVAFRDMSEFQRFLSGMLTEKGNVIEQQKESYNRITMLNMMAGAYCMGNAVNLTAGYNRKFGTSYTTAELQTTYLKEFLAYFVSTFKLMSDMFVARSVNHHYSPARKDAAGNDLVLLRHTPKDRQRALLYSPFFYDSEAMVLPEIYNDNYLKVDATELVPYWQSQVNPSAIYVTPSIPAEVTPTKTVANIPYVLGFLYDEDAMMIDYQMESALSTPVEARKGYRNTWWTFARNSINDFTENHVLFYMMDEAADQETDVETSMAN